MSEEVKPQAVTLLPPNLARLASLAATEEGRYAMESVLLETTADGYRAIATDGKMVGIIEGPLDAEMAASYPDLPGLANASNGAESAIIPREMWTRAFKMIPKLKSHHAHREMLSHLACVMGPSEVTFGATDLEQAPCLYTRTLEGRFPNVHQVIPKGQGTISIVVDPARLIEVLKVAQAVLAADDRKVTLTIHTPNLPLVVTASNAQQKCTCLLMPLV